MVRILRAERDRLRKGLSIERAAEIMRISPRYARAIELHGCACIATAARLAEITGADEIDYTVPSRVTISRREYLRLKRAAEPPKRPYGRQSESRRRLAGGRRTLAH